MCFQMNSRMRRKERKRPIKKKQKRKQRSKLRRNQTMKMRILKVGNKKSKPNKNKKVLCHRN